LQSPSNLARADEDKVSTSSKPNSKGCPHLPRHDETSSNIGWSRFCRVDWNRDFLQTHTDAKQDTCGHELTPFLRECHTEGGAEAEDCSEEDCASTSEKIIERVRDPCSAAEVSIEGSTAEFPYKKAMVIYGVELINPMIHEFLLQMAGVGQTWSSIPRAVAKVRLAPLEAANISIEMVIS
jgi:hypothetical protein